MGSIGLRGDHLRVRGLHGHFPLTESCPASPSTSGYDVVNNVRSLALRFGSIKSFKAYLAVSDQQYATAGGHARALALRSELQSSGVSLMDVPYGKDAIGKTLLGTPALLLFPLTSFANEWHNVQSIC